MKKLNRFFLMGMGGNSNIIPHNMPEFKRSYSLNTGNLIFQYASKILSEPSHVRYALGANNEVINSQSTGLIIPMANHIGSHIDLSQEGPKIQNVNVPVIVLGLGVQFELGKINIEDIPKGTISWLKSLSEKSDRKNITVRGKETGRVLSKLGFGNKIEILGCPSLLINEDINLGEKLYKKFLSSSANIKLSKLGIAAGNPHIRKLANLEKSFISLVNKHNAKYIIQHPPLLIKLSSGYSDSVTDDEFLILQKYWFENMSKEEIIDWFLTKSQTYISVPQWFYDVSKLEFVVGTRIHGIQAALQAGTPAVCLYIDIRTKELCETMGIPHAPAENFKNDLNIEEIFDIFSKWDYKAFDENRINVAKKLKNIFISNGAMISKHNLMNLN